MLNNALLVSKLYFEKIIKENDIVIDATVGNGKDTLFLRNIVGKNGKVYGFDIQQIALDNTKKLLSDNSVTNNVELILDSHINIDKYVKEKVKAVVFNLGYLPGGNHKIATKPETTITAIEKALSLIEENGAVFLTIYHGGDTGFYERDEILKYLIELDSNKYTVLSHNFINQINYPPIFIMISKK